MVPQVCAVSAQTWGFLLDLGANLSPMTRGLQRFQQSGQSHFITFSCYRRMRLLDPHLRDLFLEALEKTRQRYTLRVYGYVAMPEHVHVVISEPELAMFSLATVIQALKLSVVRRALHADGMPLQRLWQSRYYDHNIRRYESFIQKVRYMHNNPVKRGLIARPEDWRWKRPGLPHRRDWAGRDRVRVDGAAARRESGERAGASRTLRPKRSPHIETVH
jgi:putative transposase